MDNESILQTELNDIAGIQQDLFAPATDSENIFNPSYPSNVYYTMYDRSIAPGNPVRKHESQEVKTDEDFDIEVSYKLNTKQIYHCLFYTTLRQPLPMVSVKPHCRGKVEIAWVPNVGSNVLSSYRLLQDDIQMNQGDSVWSDFYVNWGTDKKHEQAIVRGIGISPMLINWQSIIPAETTSFRVPLYYAEDPMTSIPLWTAGTTHTFTQIHRYRNETRKLLLMRYKRSDGKYVITAANQNYVDFPAHLELPELIGKYASVSEDYRNHVMHCQDQLVYYFNDVFIKDSNNPEQLGQTVSMPLKCNFPAKAIFFAAQNANGVSGNRNYSNYTTRTESSKGYSPIVSYGLNYGNNIKIPMLKSDHGEKCDYQHFRRTPFQIGLHALPIGYDVFYADQEVSTILGKHEAHLVLKLGDTNPYRPVQKDEFPDLDNEDIIDFDTPVTTERSVDGREGRDGRDGSGKLSKFELPSLPDVDQYKDLYFVPDQKYNIRIRVLVMRKLVFTRDEKGDGYRVEVVDN